MNRVTKRRIIQTTIFCVPILFAFTMMMFVYDGVKEVARENAVRAGISHLAQAIELYKDDHDWYPASLDKLLSGLNPELKDYIVRNRILNDRFGDKYEYQLVTNGFVIVVTAQDRWFRKGKRLEKKYRIGEALE